LGRGAAGVEMRGAANRLLDRILIPVVSFGTKIVPAKKIKRGNSRVTARRPGRRPRGWGQTGTINREETYG